MCVNNLPNDVNQSINQSVFLMWLKWHTAITKSTIAQCSNVKWRCRGMTAERDVSLAVVKTSREMVKTGGKQAMNSRCHLIMNSRTSNHTSWSLIRHHNPDHYIITSEGRERNANLPSFTLIDDAAGDDLSFTSSLLNQHLFFFGLATTMHCYNIGTDVL